MNGDYGIVQAAPALGVNTLRFSSLYGYAARTEAKPVVSVKFVWQGEECYTVSGRSYRIGRGNYLLFEEGQSFETVLDRRQLNVGLCLDLDRALLKQAAADLFLSDPFEATQNPRAAVDFTEGLRSGEDSLGDWLRTLAVTWQAGVGYGNQPSLFYAAAARRLVASQTGQPVEGRFANTQAIQKELLHRVEAVRQRLHDDPLAPHSTESLAALCPLSPFHFIRVFRQAFGTTPHRYLVQLRLHRAKALLQVRTAVGDAALACGFADIHSFSKAFKKRYGLSPSRV